MSLKVTFGRLYCVKQRLYFQTSLFSPLLPNRFPNLPSLVFLTQTLPSIPTPARHIPNPYIYTTHSKPNKLPRAESHQAEQEPHNDEPSWVDRV
jgi:hypothetical protein